MKLLLIFIYLFSNIVLSISSSNTAISIGITPNFNKSYENELINSNDWLKILEYSSNKKVIIDIFDSYNYDFINEKNFEKLIFELKTNKVNSIDFSFSFCLNLKNGYLDIIKQFNKNLKKNNIYPQQIWINIESKFQNCYNQNNNNNHNIDNNDDDSQLIGGNLNNNNNNNNYFEKNQEYYEFTKNIINAFNELGFNNVGIKVSRETYNKVFGNKKDSKFSTVPLFYLKNDKNHEFEDYYLSPFGSWTDFKVKQFKLLNGVIPLSNINNDNSDNIQIYLNSHKLYIGTGDSNENHFNSINNHGFGSGSGGSGSSSGSSSGTSGTSGAQLSGTGEANEFFIH